MPNLENIDEQEFGALRQFSAQIGSDPRQVQGAGGNTSLKQNDVLWIKASGKWLMHANEQQMFVPVRRSALLDAFYKEDPRAEKSVDFIVSELNPSGLRPSIETTLHAVMEQPVVMHIHCVDTISFAIRNDAEQVLADMLSEFNWVFVPYVRPGLPLTQSIAARLQTDTDVLVLGNHGLVVAAKTVEQCLLLLQRVRLALHVEPRSVDLSQFKNDHHDAGSRAGNGLLSKLAHSGDYEPAAMVDAHAIAFDENAIKVAAGGSLYPDHVIFLGKGSAVALPDEDSDAVIERYSRHDTATPVSIIFPGLGVAMRKDATSGQQALARCLSDVCMRVPSQTNINYLDDQQNHELLNWEAEQYRQSLGKKSTA